MEWVAVDGGVRFVLKGKDFRLSYNPNCKGWLMGDVEEETALFLFPRKYLILNGDFRKEYEAAFPNGLSACLEVYNKYKSKFRSSWSEDEEPNKEVTAK